MTNHDEGRPSNTAEDRHWIETRQIGEYRVSATFEIINGVEIPWGTKVKVEGPLLEVQVNGPNSLVRGIQIAEMLDRNPIED